MNTASLLRPGDRKLFLTSRIQKWVGNRIFGTPQALFGIPEGLLEDFYVPEGDRKPTTRQEVITTEWKMRRVAEVWLRRMMIPQVGRLASAFLLVSAVVMVLATGSIQGVKSGWAKHEANVAQAHQKDVQQARQAAQQKLQAQLAALPDSVRSIVSTAGSSCQQLVGDPDASDKSAQWVQNMGCDSGTGIIDVAHAAAFVSRLQAEQKSLEATLAAPGTKNPMLISQISTECMQAADGTMPMDRAFEATKGCDLATGRLDLVKAQAYAKSMGGQ